MKKNNRLVAALALLPAAALAFAACSSGGGASEAPAGDGGSGEPTTLKVATVGIASDGALLTGIEQGFFEEEGLEIETSIVANPPAGLAAAQSGQVDIAYSPSIPLLNALSQGVPLHVIAAADGYGEDALHSGEPERFDDTGLFAAVGSGIESVDDLAGKTISVPARNAQLEVVIANELENAGIDSKAGVNWVVLDHVSAIQALKTGNVDASGLVNPFTAEAEAEGAKQLSAPSLEFFESGTVGMWTAGSNTIDQKSEAIAAFQRAIVKSNEYANAHPDEAISSGLEYTESSLAPEDVGVVYWPIVVEREELERPNEKLVRLGFLSELVDLDNVIFEG